MLPAGGRAGRRARGWSGGRHYVAGQYGYVPLGRHLVYTVSLCAAPSAKAHTLSEENVESSETSPDLSPLHSVLPCGTALVHDDPSKRLVEPGRPTRISVCRGKSGIGLKVIGGSDTNLVSICDSSVMCILLLSLGPTVFRGKFC